MLTDPEKMRLGLEQFASNPLLKVTHPNPNPNPNPHPNPKPKPRSS